MVRVRTVKRREEGGNKARERNGTEKKYLIHVLHVFIDFIVCCNREKRRRRIERRKRGRGRRREMERENERERERARETIYR